MCPQRMEKLNLDPALTDAMLDRPAQKMITKWEKGPHSSPFDPEKKIKNVSFFLSHSLNSLWGETVPQMYG